MVAHARTLAAVRIDAPPVGDSFEDCSGFEVLRLHRGPLNPPA